MNDTTTNQTPVKGDKIVTVLGNTYEVIRVLGNMVLVQGARRWVHIDQIAYIVSNETPTPQLAENTVVKTVMGEWVQVVSQRDNMVTVDYVASFRGRSSRTQIHISKLLLHTAHQLSKKVTTV